MTGFKLNLIYINVAKQDQMFYISRASMPHVVQGGSVTMKPSKSGSCTKFLAPIDCSKIPGKYCIVQSQDFNILNDPTESIPCENQFHHVIHSRRREKEVDFSLKINILWDLADWIPYCMVPTQFQESIFFSHSPS
jgi:hypothetical protein